MRRHFWYFKAEKRVGPVSFSHVKQILCSTTSSRWEPKGSESFHLCECMHPWLLSTETSLPETIQAHFWPIKPDKLFPQAKLAVHPITTSYSWSNMSDSALCVRQPWSDQTRAYSVLTVVKDKSLLFWGISLDLVVCERMLVKLAGGGNNCSEGRHSRNLRYENCYGIPRSLRCPSNSFTVARFHSASLNKQNKQILLLALGWCLDKYHGKLKVG